MYTYSLAIESKAEDDEGLHYWAGGQVWSKYPEDAARFASMDKAEATIEIFKKFDPKLSPTVHVVQLPNDDG